MILYFFSDKRFNVYYYSFEKGVYKMRKIIVFNLVSVDGFFAGKDGNLDWHNVDDEFNKFAIEQMKEFETIIFGRTTYQLFENFWPAALKDQNTSEDNRKVAQRINDLEKNCFFQYS